MKTTNFVHKEVACKEIILSIRSGLVPECVDTVISLEHDGKCLVLLHSIDRLYSVIYLGVPIDINLNVASRYASVRLETDDVVCDFLSVSCHFSN